MIYASMNTTPKGYFYDNSRIRTREEMDSDYSDSDEETPLEGFSVNLITFHFYSESN
jgi:hypothetical protein